MVKAFHVDLNHPNSHLEKKQGSVIFVLFSPPFPGKWAKPLYWLEVEQTWCVKIHSSEFKSGIPISDRQQQPCYISGPTFFFKRLPPKRAFIQET